MSSAAGALRCVLPGSVHFERIVVWYEDCVCLNSLNLLSHRKPFYSFALFSMASSALEVAALGNAM
jgi:hypothetical protein